MEAKELRVGNIIGRKFMNPGPTGLTTEISPVEVKEIREESLNTTMKIGRNERFKGDYGCFRPIPLTEEWLLKFGFEYKLYQSEHKRLVLTHENLFVIEYDDDDDDDTITLWIDREGIEMETIKYIHQLQNLYFSLTGQELIITTNGTKQVEKL